jgi:hypothetical protein
MYGYSRYRWSMLASTQIELLPARVEQLKAERAEGLAGGVH